MHLLSFNSIGVEISSTLLIFQLCYTCQFFFHFNFHRKVDLFLLPSLSFSPQTILTKEMSCLSPDGDLYPRAPPLLGTHNNTGCSVLLLSLSLIMSLNLSSFLWLWSLYLFPEYYLRVVGNL